MGVGDQAPAGPRVALVCSWLNPHGGAERVLETMHEMWPEAPIYTSAYLPDVMPPEYRRWDIRTSFMQHLPGLRRHFQKYLPLFPIAFEQFDSRNVFQVRPLSGAQVIEHTHAVPALSRGLDHAHGRV